MVRLAGSRLVGLSLYLAKFLPSRAVIFSDDSDRTISRLLGYFDTPRFPASIITCWIRGDRLAAKEPGVPAQPGSKCYSALGWIAS